MYEKYLFKSGGIIVEFHDVVKHRREVTSFINKPIPNEVLDDMLETAWLAPTGNNLLSREFIVIRKQNMLEHLSETTPFMPWLTEAAVAIVVTGRPEVSKYWLQDASIASGYIGLAAVNAGLGCAFGAVYHSTDQMESKKRESHVRDALTIPDDRKIVAILGLGYENKKPSAKTMPKKSEVIHFDTFNS